MAILISYYSKNKIVIPIVIIVVFMVSNLYIFNDYVAFNGFANFWNNGDFVLSVTTGIYNYNTIYATNYPPLSALIFVFLKKITVLYNGTVESSAVNYIIQIFLISMVAVVVVSGQQIIKHVKYKNVYLFGILMSSVFLFAVQRMNSILFAFALILLFLVLDSYDNKYLKIGAIICLAFSANIKYFPAIYGLFYIKEKRWKDSVLCLIFGVLLFFLPMLFSDQNNIMKLVEATTQFADDERIMGSDMSMLTIVYNILSPFGVESKTIINISFVVKLLVFAWCIFSFFISKRRDIELLSLGFICVLCITSTTLYSVLFLLPAYLEYVKLPITSRLDYFNNFAWIIVMGYFWGMAEIYYIQGANSLVPLFILFVIYVVDEIKCNKNSIIKNDIVVE